MMDSIKSRIHRRITPEQVKVKRLAYKSNLPDFRFKRVNITGANEQQKQYIQKSFMKRLRCFHYGGCQTSIFPFVVR